jgi:serine/threonine protein phosphatase 1
VLDTIFDLQKKGYSVRCLRGNHEEMILEAADTFDLEHWLESDALTLRSFGVSHYAHIPEPYLAFMRDLPYFFETDGYILVHAGLDFNLPDPLADTSEMCWIRHWYNDIRYEWLDGRIILHGHTPMEFYNIEKQQVHLDTHRYLDLDAGCVYNEKRYPHRAGLGRLCAFDMTNRRLIFQENVE